MMATRLQIKFIPVTAQFACRVHAAAAAAAAAAATRTGSIRTSIRCRIGSHNNNSYGNTKRQFSSENTTPTTTTVTLYTGEFTGRLRWLRRVSFGSSVLTLVGIPVVASIGLGSMSIVGQVLIVGTAFFTSLSSTLFLHLVTHPYVVSVKEITKSSSSSGKNSIEGSSSSSLAKNGATANLVEPDPLLDRRFIITRVNIVGMDEHTEFTLKEASRANLSNPFSSVKIRGKSFYLFGGRVNDLAVRHALTNEL